MKRTLIAVCLLLLIAAPVMAHPRSKHPASTELTGGVSYIKPADGGSSWTLAGEVLVPLSHKGFVYLGPTFVIHNGPSDDSQAAGAVAEFVFTGVNGPFAGASILYDLDAPDGVDDHTVNARAGLKFGVGHNGLIKLYLEKSVDGYGKSEDIRGVGAIGLRF